MSIAEFTPREPDSPPSDQRQSERIAALAAKAEDLEAIKKSLEGAATVGAPLWLSYLFLLFYIAIAAAAVTHSDLLLEKAVDLPFLNIKLPMKAFFVVAPLLFLITHTYTMAHFVLLSDKAKHFHLQLRKSVVDHGQPGHLIREALRRQLPINIFVQFLSGPEDIRERPFSILLWTTAWTSLVAAPILLLLLLQLQFLPYHDNFVSWWHRLAILLDLIVIGWLWLKILAGRSDEDQAQSRGRLDLWARLKRIILWLSRYVFSYILNILIVLFSWWVATYPSEWQEPPYKYAAWLEWKAVTDFVFGNRDVAHVDARPRWPSNCLKLKGFDLYVGLGVDDPKKLDWKQYIIDLQGRHLECADLRRTKFAKANLSASFLRGANLGDGDFSVGSFVEAHLEDASLRDARFLGAKFNDAFLQGATMDGAYLQGVTLEGAFLQGASFVGTQLQGGSLEGAHIQGAWLMHANLQGATLIEADLRGASLGDAFLLASQVDTTKIDGASFRNAHLQASSFSAAEGKAVDFSGSYLWRTQWGYVTGTKLGSLNLGDGLNNDTGNLAKLSSLNLGDGPNWRPLVGEPKELVQLGLANDRIGDSFYKNVSELMDDIPDKDIKGTALDRINLLRCKKVPDPALASCNAKARLPADALRWKQLIQSSQAPDTQSYRRALAAVFSELLCSDNQDGIYVLRGLLKEDSDSHQKSHLSDAGPEGIALVKEILGGRCGVSTHLNADDDAALRKLVKESMATSPGPADGNPRTTAASPIASDHPRATPAPR